MARPKNETVDYKGLDLLVDDVVFTDAGGNRVSLRAVLAALQEG